MSLAEEIERLRKAAGSHDKFAAQLGTSRQTVIGWEKGRWPRDYVSKLVAAGIPAELFEEEARRSVERRLDALEEQAKRRSQIAQDALAATKALQKQLKQLQTEVRKLARQVSAGSAGQTVGRTRSARATRAKRPPKPE